MKVSHQQRINNKSGESGFAVLEIVTVVTILLLIVVFAIGLFIFFIFLPDSLGTLGTSTANSTTATSTGMPSSNPSTIGNTNMIPLEMDNSDTNIGELRCVNLPGVSFPRTPALDRRVAILLLRVKQDLDARSIPTVTYNWGFRTSCQQALVRPTGKLKAAVGTSPHEAGAAVDVNGLSQDGRADRQTIVSVFEQHGWTWLGRKGDPPHFQVAPYIVGVRSMNEWIKASQTFFKNGGPQGCRGTDCGQ